ncbi:MAG TPA: hypothetical protein VGW14_04725 [Thermoleophilaceae bacterium]|nr:hypothetical protein [Thermoleophilaceae bacterium]
MTTIRRFQPTPAFVVAIVALVVSMSGTAVAVTALAPNSVKSKHIVNGQVKAKDLAADSVRGPKVQDGSLTGADVQDDSLTGADVNESTLQGVMASKVRMVISQGPPQQFGGERVASCEANEKAIGGGAVWLQPGTNSPTQLEAPVTASMPEPAVPAAESATGWRGAGRNLSGVDRTFRVYAVCVPRQP